MFLHSFRLPVYSKLRAICLAGSLLISGIANAEPLQLSIVLSEKEGPYLEFSAALRADLSNSDVKLYITDTTEPLPNAVLVIAVGMKAAHYVAQSKTPKILNVMIPKAGHQNLIREFPAWKNSPLYSTIYLDQPVERQLSLIAAALPDRERIGLLFDSPPPEEVYQLRSVASGYGFKLYEQEIKSDNMFESLQKVLKHSDILLALPVPAVYNSSTLRNILVSTYQAGIPLVGFSSAYVKAGAICAVFSTPAQFSTQAATAIQIFIATGTLPPSQYPKYFEVEVNDRVASSLAIKIKRSDELVRLMANSRKRNQ